MIAHAMLAVTDYEKAKLFYQKALAPLGYEFTEDHPDWKAGGYKEGGHTSFWIGEKPSVVAGHVAFEAKSAAEVDGFYKTAMASGGTDNGAPGYRVDYWPGYYAAFVHDADQNNIEAVWFDYSKVQ